MTPVNFLNRSLIRDALCKREGSVSNLRRPVSMNESQNSGVRSVSLCHCERDRGDSHKQKQAKHASTDMPLDLLASVRFHFISHSGRQTPCTQNASKMSRQIRS